MTDRELTLTEFLRDRLNGRVILVVEPPNDAGVHFEDFGGWKLLLHAGQVVAMSAALTDEEFDQFTDAVADWAALTLANVTDDDDLEQAIFIAQTAVAEKSPDAYMLMDSVFSTD